MARTLFGRGARGGLIVDLQSGLIAKGIPLEKVDGDFGPRTETAVRTYQAQIGTAETGVVNTDEWVELTGKPAPTLAERCLQVTSAFEGHGYTKAAGNWDGAWLTWGVIGFTMKFAGVQKIIRAVERGAPHCIEGAFREDALALLQGISGTEAEQQAWAERISAPGGHRLIEPWQSAFARFGEFPEVQAAQRQCAFDNYFIPAVRAAANLGLTTELGIALLFDIHVQNGGVPKQVRDALPPLGPGHTERSRRVLIANGVADHSLPQFRENVRRRKLAIATGAGIANGVHVVLASWGLEDVPAVVA